VDVSVADSHSRNAPALIDMATDNANGWYARVMRFPVYPEAIDGRWAGSPSDTYNNHSIRHSACISKEIIDHRLALRATITPARWTATATCLHRAEA
jgi:hypothetical protein